MKIGNLIRQSSKPFFSLEFFPPSEDAQLGGFYEMADLLRQSGPLFVSVTYGAGGAKQQKTLDVTGELAQRGFEVMAHLTCVGANPQSLKDYIDKLLRNGVNNILALRGDPPAHVQWNWDDGYFRHAIDLVTFAKKQIPTLGIGVAAYPAPHPESPSFEFDRYHTAEKIAAGADFAITQLFFDVREYEELLNNLQKRGLDVPVIPGVMPIQNLSSIKRVLSLCGANIPGKFYLELEAAHEKGGTEAVREVGIKFALNQIHNLLKTGARGIHLYTLNKADICSLLIKESGLA